MFQTKRNSSLLGRYADGSTIIIPNNNKKKMEKGLKIWQAVVSLILLAITVGTLIVNLSNKVETQKVKIEFLESNQRDLGLMLKEKVQSDNHRFDKIQEQLTQILVELQTKQNAKR